MKTQDIDYAEDIICLKITVYADYYTPKLSEAIKRARKEFKIYCNGVQLDSKLFNIEEV